MADEIKGFTLIELVIVITIIGIIAALATVEIGWWMRSTNLTEMRDTLLADVEYAKRLSIGRSPHGLFFYSGKYEIRVLQDCGTCSGDTSTTCCSDTDCSSGQFCVGNFVRDSGESTGILSDGHSSGTVSFPAGMTLSWDVCGGDLELWFDRKGVPRCSDWSIGVGTLTLTKGTLTKKLTVSSTGMITNEQ